MLPTFSDNHFDLAIVDPPYGIDWMQQIQNPNTKANWKQYENKEWDKQTPTDEYWEQLFRVSKNQIVWSGNYMSVNKILVSLKSKTPSPSLYNSNVIE